MRARFCPIRTYHEWLALQCTWRFSRFRRPPPPPPPQGYGYVYANDTASFALPLLLKDECVREDEITGSITIKATCDAALIKGVIGVDKHVTTGIAQFMGHGAPGKELAQNQFPRNMSSDRAVVMRTGRGADKEPGWLTDNWIPMLRQISAINGAKQQFEIIQGLAPLQRTADGGYVWKGPKVCRTTRTHPCPAAAIDGMCVVPALVRNRAMAMRFQQQWQSTWMDLLLLGALQSATIGLTPSSRVFRMQALRSIGCVTAHPLTRCIAQLTPRCCTCTDFRVRRRDRLLPLPHQPIKHFA